MKSRILQLILVSAILCFTSCDQLAMLGNQMKLDQTEFDLPAAGGEVRVSFTPLSSWSVECSDSFVKLNPSSGEASENPVTLVIKVEENKDVEKRTIKVLLSFETNDIVLTIRQDGATPPDTPVDPDPDDPNPDDPNPDDPNPDDPNPDDPNPDDPDPDDPNPDDPNPDDPNPDDPNPDDPDPDDPDPDDPNPDDPNPDDPNPDDPDEESDGSTEDVIPGDDIKTK